MDTSLEPKQSHSDCNQYAAKYGNTIQACVGTIFELLPTASHRKCGGFSLKEESCNDSKFIVTQMYEECIYETHI